MPNIQRSKEEWQSLLSEEEYHVLREKGTEYAFSGKYYECDEEGIYHCKGCGHPLFSSANKYHSGCGWPAFDQPITEDAVEEHEDISHGMRRIEITCANCGGHLGHVFPDGPEETTGMRYCINSVSLDLDPKE
jgi:peptide-methionine (R)-S-oxide reductase